MSITVCLLTLILYTIPSSLCLYGVYVVGNRDFNKKGFLDLGDVLCAILITALSITPLLNYVVCQRMYDGAVFEKLSNKIFGKKIFISNKGDK